MTRRKIAILSNVTIDLIVGKLRKKYEFYVPDGFDTWVQETIDPSSGLYNGNIDAIVVLIDGTEARSWRNIDEGVERVKCWKQALTTLASKISTLPIFVSTIDIRENRIKSLSERKLRFELENDWYQFAQNLVETRNNVYIIDLADLISEIGRKQFYSNKMWYMSNMPYSRDGLNAIALEIDKVLGAAFESRKKIIALDLDNTLWGGVIGEDGVDGIELSNHKEGQRYYDFQCQLLEMKKRGVVLGVVSKNNEEDAERAIRNHPAMLLRDDEFVSKKINWENKAVNLKLMAKELNLTEGSFIFIDDNPAEREVVKGECPDVLVPEFPIDSAELLGYAEGIWFDYCRPLRVLDEDFKKTEMYQNDLKRKQEFVTSFDLDDYISKLEMIVDIHKMKKTELERVVQLINKTNQFNLTTKRYTQEDIFEIASNHDDAIYVTYLSDKYGDDGLVSVIILEDHENDISIDTFLMSCRVMGRKLEDVILNELATKYHKKIIGEYIPTQKNAPVSELYDRLGFDLISNDDGHKIYELDGTRYLKKNVSFYKEIKFGE